jgi:O-antigen ligase
MSPVKSLKGLSKKFDKILLVFFTLVLFCFSTDLRLGLNFRPGGSPDFQLFEFPVFILLAIILILLPKLLLVFEVELSREDWLYLFFVINMAIMVPFARDQLHAISRVKDFILAGFLYFSLTRSGFGKKQLRYLLWISVLFASFWALIGIMQWAGIDAIPLKLLDLVFLSSRAQLKTFVDISAGEVVMANFAHGAYAFPQTFVYYLVFPFFISIGMWGKSKLYMVASSLIFTAVIGTLSKTFLLLFLVVITSVLIYRVFRNYTVASLLLLGLGIFTLLSIVFFGNLEFWVRALATFTTRLEMWQDVGTLFLSKPSVLLVGHGTEELYYQYSRFHYPNPHNMFLYLLAEYGIIGTLLFSLFIYNSLRKIVGSFHESLSKSSEWVGLFGGICFFLLMGIVDDIFVLNQLDSTFMFYFGILMRAAHLMLHSKKNQLLPEVADV